MGINMEKLKQIIDSGEAKEYFDKIRQEEDRINAFLDRQAERLHKMVDFEGFVDKVIAKYESDEYRSRWWSRGIEPQEMLFDVLLHYASKYGRDLGLGEYLEQSNPFTAELKYCRGYYFHLMIGQGSVIHVTKAKTQPNEQ